MVAGVLVKEDNGVRQNVKRKIYKTRIKNRRQLVVPLHCIVPVRNILRFLRLRHCNSLTCIQGCNPSHYSGNVSDKLCVMSTWPSYLDLLYTAGIAGPVHFQSLLPGYLYVAFFFDDLYCVVAPFIRAVRWHCGLWYAGGASKKEKLSGGCLCIRGMWGVGDNQFLSSTVRPKVKKGKVHKHIIRLLLCPDAVNSNSIGR